jgi:hypothetical protein
VNGSIHAKFSRRNAKIIVSFHRVGHKQWLRNRVARNSREWILSLRCRGQLWAMADLANACSTLTWKRQMQWTRRRAILCNIFTAIGGGPTTNVLIYQSFIGGHRWPTSFAITVGPPGAHWSLWPGKEIINACFEEGLAEDWKEKHCYDCCYRRPY